MTPYARALEKVKNLRTSPGRGFIFWKVLRLLLGFEEMFTKAMIELLELGKLKEKVHPQKTIHAAAGRQGMRHDLQILNTSSERFDFRHANNSQILRSTGRNDASPVIRQSRIATNSQKGFWGHECYGGSSIDNGANEMRSLRTEKLNTNDPQARSHRRLLECGLETGWQDRTGVNGVKPPFVGSHRFKQILFSRTVPNQPSCLRLKRSFIDFIQLDQQPLVFVALQDFLDGLTFHKQPQCITAARRVQGRSAGEAMPC